MSLAEVTAVEVPTVTFDEFLDHWYRVYKQDQHVMVIGPTDCGKTTLITELIKVRGHVVAMGVKHVDESLAKLCRKDSPWHRVQEWKLRPRSAHRIVLWPKVSDLDKVQKIHNKVFGDMLKSIYKIGHWTIWIDELTYLADHCGLKKMIRQMYILARSNKISLVAAAQRPAWIPLEAYNQAQHMFLFRTGHEADLTKMGSLNGTSARQVARIVANLPFRSFLYINLTNGHMLISSTSNTKKGK